MKTVTCGELIPGCTETVRAETEEELLAQVGRHVQEAHGMAVTPELVEQVRAHIREADGRGEAEGPDLPAGASYTG